MLTDVVFCHNQISTIIDHFGANELTRVFADVCVVREVDCPLVHSEHGARDAARRVGHLTQEQSPPRFVMAMVICRSHH